MNYIKISIAVFCITLLFSCESVVSNFEFQDEDPKLNLVYFADADSSSSLYLGRTISMNESIENYIVDHAKITLTHSESNYEFSFSNDFYHNDSVRLQEGNSYSMSASAEGYESVSADFYVPQKSNIISVDYSLDSVLTDYWGETNSYYDVIYIKIKFAPQTNGVDYYELTTGDYEYFYRESTYVTTVKSDDTYYNIEGIDDDESSLTALYFSDEIIGKGTNTLTVRLDIFSLDQLPTVSGTPGIWFYLNSIDENYYKYVYSKGKYDESEDNFLVEPATIFSNVENGAGLVCGRTIHAFFVDFSDIAVKENDSETY